MEIKHILLVEDNPADVELMMETLDLADLGAKVSVCHDGVEAMRFLRHEGIYADSQRPDLILLDLVMPKKDGSAVLEEINRDVYLSRIPVVVLTSSKAEEDIIRSYKLNAVSYILKPVSIKQLSFALQAVAHLSAI